MRLKARQSRFICGTIGGWIAARAAMLATWPGALAVPAKEAGFGLAPSPLRWPHGAEARFVPPRPCPVSVPPRVIPLRASRRLPVARGRLHSGAAQTAPRYVRFASLREEIFTPSVALPFVPHAPLARAARSRWSAEAYLFARPGGGRPGLAAGGTLGGSQVAARLTYRLNAEGPVRTALAARFYAPLSGGGREGAVGVDWHPAPAVPLRLSIERRMALDARGRNAWSAYAAGGFYREPIGGVLAVDGYAQAGVVGAHARDLFVDGALRAGRRLSLGPATATVGGGLWGAAQPGVSRVDAGPRVGVVLAVADHVFSVAVEGRLRVAGRASPGSGAALTLGVDL